MSFLKNNLEENIQVKQINIFEKNNHLLLLAFRKGENIFYYLKIPNWDGISSIKIYTKF